MSGFGRLVRNSAANVAAGTANALLSVALPPILVRHLSTAEFATWSVVLQLAAVVFVFQFGVQVAVGRYVAYCTARGDETLRRQIVSTAFAAMWASAVVAVAVVAAMSALLADWFPGMPEALRGDARVALILIGASLALGLPASVVAGIESGLQRNEVPAAFIVVSRVAVAVALYALATAGAGLVAMACAYAAIIGGAAVALLAYGRVRHPAFAARRISVTLAAGRELAGYCTSLTIWSLAMLVISGLDAVIAGRIDFHWAAYFGVAASAVALIVGLQSAMLQPLIAVAARLHSDRRTDRLGALLIDASRVNTLVFLVAIAPFFVAGEWLTRQWVGDAMAPVLLPIVRVLLIGVLLRQTLAPFATILLGTGEQRLVVLPPIVEAVVKLGASIALGLWVGPVGIALGTVVGGAVCLVTNVVFIFPRVAGVAIDMPRFLVRGIVQPVAVFAPLFALPLLAPAAGRPAAWVLGTVFVAVVVVGASAVAVGSLRRIRALV